MRDPGNQVDPRIAVFFALLPFLTNLCYKD